MGDFREWLHFKWRVKWPFRLKGRLTQVGPYEFKRAERTSEQKTKSWEDSRRSKSD